MKTLKSILFGMICLFGINSFGGDYIILFHQSEIVLSSLGHEDFQNLLQSTNQKNVDQLKEWLGSKNIRSRVGDMWLVRGATAQLEESEAKELEREPWVHGVYKDQLRKFVTPSPNLIVKNKLSELEDDPDNLWGLDKIGLYKIKTDFPELTGKGVRVGILDTGIQNKHEEFKRVDAAGATYYNTIAFKDFINNLDNAYDDHGHGTHVAGTISGSKVGIAPDASLIVAKVFTA